MTWHNAARTLDLWLWQTELYYSPNPELHHGFGPSKTADSWRVPQHGPGIFRVFDAMRSPSEQWLPLFRQLDDHPRDVTFEDSQRVSPGTLPCSFPAAREDGDLWLEHVAYLNIFYITWIYNVYIMCIYIYTWRVYIYTHNVYIYMDIVIYIYMDIDI